MREREGEADAIYIIPTIDYLTKLFQMDTIIYAIIKITFHSELTGTQAVADLEQNAQYVITSTDKSTVVETEWIASTNYQPENEEK